MKVSQFFRIFAIRVEKVTRQPVEMDGEFDWRGYFDPDAPGEAQARDAVLAADEFLSENGYRCDAQAWAEAAAVLDQLVS